MPSNDCTSTSSDSSGQQKGITCDQTHRGIWWIYHPDNSPPGRRRWGTSVAPLKQAIVGRASDDIRIGKAQIEVVRLHEAAITIVVIGDDAVTGPDIDKSSIHNGMVKTSRSWRFTSVHVDNRLEEFDFAEGHALKKVLTEENCSVVSSLHDVFLKEEKESEEKESEEKKLNE